MRLALLLITVRLASTFEMRYFAIVLLMRSTAIVLSDNNSLDVRNSGESAYNILNRLLTVDIAQIKGV